MNVTSLSASDLRLAEKLRASHCWGGANLQIWMGKAVQSLAPPTVRGSSMLGRADSPGHSSYR
jgi:hypothetical protein